MSYRVHGRDGKFYRPPGKVPTWKTCKVCHYGRSNCPEHRNWETPYEEKKNSEAKEADPSQGSEAH